MERAKTHEQTKKYLRVLKTPQVWITHTFYQLKNMVLEIGHLKENKH